MATLFFSYSHRDEALRNELEIHLSMLKRQGILEAWHDRRIVAGEEFDKAIRKKLEEADIILLLISPDFLASDYCYDIEMKRALERHAKKEACVIPVILRPCDWRNALFGNLLAMPMDGKPVSKFPDKDDAFLEVVNAIRQAVTNLTPDSVPAPSPSRNFDLSANPQVLDVARSSNLRIKKTFSDHERDTFLEESFEYIANFFENSLYELSRRNTGIDNRFKRIDANHFTAIVYVSGQAATECRIAIVSSGSFFASTNITYSHSASGRDNSYNESISIVDDGYTLFLQPLGLQASFYGQNVKKLISQQGAAEYFWDMLISRLQQ